MSPYSTHHVCMKFYNVLRPLYLEIDASGIGLGTGFLQVKDGMNCGHNEIPGNAKLQSAAFTRKTLSSGDDTTVT